MNEKFEFKVKGSVIKNVPLSKIGLNRRAEHCLMRADIWDVEGLVEVWDKIHMLRGAGTDTVKEIHSKFFDWYRTRVYETDKWPEFKDSISLVHEVQA